jgi:hypothetical protein
MKPFILRAAKQIPAELGPAANQAYDAEKQIWIDTNTGEAVVSQELADPIGASRFGETTITETREGADQTEVAGIQASRFGETSMTKSMEGTDQGEGTYCLSSRFGETTSTATREGIDQSEVSKTT